MSIEKVRKEIAKVLKQEETPDMFPPYRCLPIGSVEWIEFKVKRILAIEIGGEVPICEDLIETSNSGNPYYHTEYKGVVSVRQYRPRTIGDAVKEVKR